LVNIITKTIHRCKNARGKYKQIDMAYIGKTRYQKKEKEKEKMKKGISGYG